MRFVRFFNRRPNDGEARVMSEEEVASARAEMGALQLRRDIANAAMRLIEDARGKMPVPEEERDRLTAHYRGELAEVEGKIAKLQSVLAVYDLERAKRNLVREFEERLREIERLIAEAKRGTGAPIAIQFKDETLELLRKGLAEAKAPAPEATATEKRLESLREEVLKAIERLEQIESEV